MTRLTLFFASFLAGPALACDGPTLVDAQGNGSHIEIIAGDCATQTRLQADGAAFRMEANRATGLTRAWVLGDQQSATLRNLGGAFTLYVPNCPPGLNPITVENLSRYPGLAIGRCGPKLN